MSRENHPGRMRAVALLALAAVSLVVVLSLTACAGDDSTAPTPPTRTATLPLTATDATPSSNTPVTKAAATPTPNPQTYADPFAYCVANKDQLHPGVAAGYSGPVEPPAIVKGLETASGAAPGGLQHFADQGAVYWRCMGGAVYGCSPGANLQCYEADTTATPNKAMQDYCASQPDGPIPAYVTGHSTIFEWLCSGKTAVKGRQLVQLDAAGLNSTIWYKIPQP